MSDTLNELADKLALDCIAVQKEIGNDRLFMELAQELGASSQTLEEAFLTSVRTRMASEKGRRFLAERLKEFRDAAGSKDASDKS